MLGLSCVLTLGCAEALVRFVDGGAMPMIHLFEATEGRSVRLSPDSSMKIMRPGTDPWELAISEAGFRATDTSAPPPPTGGWLAVGDSQVMGNGVAADEAFPALARVNGTPMVNAGVPGFGVDDAIQKAESLLETLQPKGVVVIINQMNDWDETTAPVGSRYVVRGGWLLDADDDKTARSAFLASPLSRSHLFFLVGQLALRDWDAPPPEAPGWMTDPRSEGRATLKIARAVQAFAARNPSIQVVPAYLPADLYAAEARQGDSPLTPHLHAVDIPPWEDTRLRDATLEALTGLQPLDLTAALQGKAEHFLTNDYHLSPSGHAAVAGMIVDHITRIQASQE